MPDPTLAELAARVEALEQRGIKLSDLPMSELRRRIELDCTFDPEQLSQSYLALRAAGFNAATAGLAGLVFSASIDATPLTVVHSLAAVPTYIMFGQRGTAAASIIPVAPNASRTAVQFELRGRAPGGALSQTVNVEWIAFA